MKKKIIFFCLAFVTLFGICSMLAKPAQAEGHGKLVIHYQNWTGSYENTGLWSWDNGNTNSAFDKTGTDSFGGVYEIPVGADAKATIGVIVMDSGYINGSGYTAWDNGWVKGTSDLSIDATKLINDEVSEMHVYCFYSPSITTDNFFVANPEASNVFVVYFAPEYEEELGVHYWGGYGSADWGTPVDVFKEASESISGKKVMITMLSNPTPADGGFLIYAGTDDTKKTANNASDSVTDLATLELGAVRTLYVTAGEPYYGETAYADFVSKAFTFKFEGDTKAMNPNTIMVSLSQEVKVKEQYDTGETQPGTEKQNKWFPSGEAFAQTDKTFTPAVIPELSVGMAGRVIFHYQTWDGDYTGAGLWTWGSGTGGTSDGVANIGVDSFGAVSIVEFAADAKEVGLIPIQHEIGTDDRWTYRETPDGQHITYNVEGKTGDIHLYYFQGGLQTVFEASKEKANVLVVYCAESYEENLGVHYWGGYGETIDYGSPAKVFVDGSKSPSTAAIKVALLQTADPAGSGFLIYAGTDETKKTPENASNAITDAAELSAGSVVVLYVNSNKTYYGATAKADFAASAFTEGEWREVDVEIQVPVMGERTRLFKDMFQVVCGEQALEIERVDVNESKEATMEFVIILKEALDNTKEYTLYYSDNGVDTIEMPLDMDTQKPVVTILGETEIVIDQYQAWDNALFPLYTASDDREGNIMNRVYVKPGEGKVNPNVAGSYEVVLTAFDDWGNEGTATFTITVKAIEEAAGCKNSAAAMMIQILSAVSLFALVLRKKH